MSAVSLERGNIGHPRDFRNAPGSRQPMSGSHQRLKFSSWPDAGQCRRRGSRAGRRNTTWVATSRRSASTPGGEASMRRPIFSLASATFALVPVVVRRTTFAGRRGAGASRTIALDEGLGALLAIQPHQSFQDAPRALTMSEFGCSADLMVTPVDFGLLCRRSGANSAAHLRRVGSCAISWPVPISVSVDRLSSGPLWARNNAARGGLSPLSSGVRWLLRLVVHAAPAACLDNPLH
jgi:hypothetical protein